jgi:two-component system, OmpR family, sensor kinase
MIMLRSLHWRLLLIFTFLLLPAGALFIAMSLQSARAYYQEITQHHNASLADNLVRESDALKAGALGEGELDDLVKMMAMAHPGVEIYVLDAAGRVMAGPPSVELIKCPVDLAPIHRFLEALSGGGANLPILGTDPQREGQVVFSAGRLPNEQGFLYVVLTDEMRASLARTVQNSTSLRLVLWGSGIGLIVLLAAGAISFSLLTKRLRHLAVAVRAFNLQARVEMPLLSRPEAIRDEIDELCQGFAELAERVRDQYRVLEQSDAARRDLVTSISHDLRTPLTTLRGSLETLNLQAFPHSEQSARYLDAARRSALRLSRLIDQLFELTCLEGPDVPLHLEPFALPELADDVVQKFAPKAEAQGVNLELNGTPEFPLVLGDIGQIERVLSNLLDNALRHTPRNGRISVRVDAEKRLAVVWVCDTGTGIAKENLPRIFERFYRVEQARGGDGAGLGLAIAQRIVQLHGGEITATSELGAGTSVRFTLPLAD